MRRRLTVRSRRTRLLALGTLLGIDASCAASQSAAPEDVVPAAASVHDLRDGGNCWLYAAAGWGEALEYGAVLDAAAGSKIEPPAQWSVAYLDYWDWYAKITSGSVAAGTDLAVQYQLDSGGSWGLAVELMAARGTMRASAFSGTTVEGPRMQNALERMSVSLRNGALRTAAARRDHALVRAELDAAFELGASAKGALGATFGDGTRTFDEGAVARGGIVAPSAMAVRTPTPEGGATTRTLREVIGDRMQADTPDRRRGTWAWSTATYEQTGASYTRSYLTRIQRALAARVPLPMTWFVAANADPEEDGTYVTRPREPANAASFGPTATLLTDSQAELLRVRSSWGRRTNAEGPAGYDDLYLDYLTQPLEVCPAGMPTGSATCWTEIPLEDVALPAGF